MNGLSIGALFKTNENVNLNISIFDLLKFETHVLIQIFIIK